MLNSGKKIYQLLSTFREGLFNLKGGGGGVMFFF